MNGNSLLSRSFPDNHFTFRTRLLRVPQGVHGIGRKFAYTVFVAAISELVEEVQNVDDVASEDQDFYA